jgi:hypothetical protein
MLHLEMTELVRGSPPLDAHGSARRYEDAWGWVSQIGTKQTLEWTKQKRQVDCLDGSENIDIATPGLDKVTQAEVLMQPSGCHRPCSNRARVVRRHHED